MHPSGQFLTKNFLVSSMITIKGMIHKAVEAYSEGTDSYIKAWFRPGIYVIEQTRITSEAIPKKSTLLFVNLNQEKMLATCVFLTNTNAIWDQTTVMK